MTNARLTDKHAGRVIVACYRVGDWGNLDVIGGLRYLRLPARVDYSPAPTRNGATSGGMVVAPLDADCLDLDADRRGQYRAAALKLDEGPGHHHRRCQTRAPSVNYSG